MVELLLSYSPHVNIQDSKGNTALMKVLQSGLVEGATLLLKHKAGVNLRNTKDLTALDIAKIKDNKEMIGLLEDSMARDNAGILI
jgi:ankyrin repeat protein